MRLPDVNLSEHALHLQPSIRKYSPIQYGSDESQLLAAAALIENQYDFPQIFPICRH